MAEPNSNAMSLWAKVPPYLPFFTIIPTALVFAIHSETLNTKLGKPACDLKWSNSTTLKPGLLICSQVPINSSV